MLYIYSLGIVACSVCVPKDWTPEQIEQETNNQSPTGISSAWKLSDDPTFSGGENNPYPCGLDTDRLHYLLIC